MFLKCKRVALIFLMALPYQVNYGQSITRSSFSCLGSVAMDNGLIIRQTVGQPSNTTLFSNGGLMLRQGFQQPVTSFKMEDGALLLDFTLSPNPANDETFLELAEEMSQVTITIRNISGVPIKEIKELSLRNRWISLKGYPPGIYVISVTGNNMTGSKKLIITS